MATFGDGEFWDGVENKLGERTSTFWMGFGDFMRLWKPKKLVLGACGFGMGAARGLPTFGKYCERLDWFVFVDAFVAAFDAAVERLTVEIGDTFKRLNGRDFMAMNGCRFGCGDRGRGDPVVDVTSSFAPFNLNLTILSAPTESRETCKIGDDASSNKIANWKFSEQKYFSCVQT